MPTPWRIAWRTRSRTSASAAGLRTNAPAAWPRISGRLQPDTRANAALAHRTRPAWSVISTSAVVCSATRARRRNSADCSIWRCVWRATERAVGSTTSSASKPSSTTRPTAPRIKSRLSRVARASAISRNWLDSATAAAEAGSTSTCRAPAAASTSSDLGSSRRSSNNWARYQSRSRAACQASSAGRSWRAVPWARAICSVSKPSICSADSAASASSAVSCPALWACGAAALSSKAAWWPARCANTR